MKVSCEARPNGWWRLFGRPVAAYCAAAVAAGAAVGFVAVPFISEMTFSQALAGGLVFGLMLSPYIGVFALVPSMAALAVVKALGLRRGMSDSIAGGLIGAVLITLIYQLGSSSFDLGRIDLLEAVRFGLAGLVGGFTYWFVAGRPLSRHQAATRCRPVDPSAFD